MGRIGRQGLSCAVAVGLMAFAVPAAAQEPLTKADMKALTALSAAAEARDCDSVTKLTKPLLERRQRALPGDFAVALYQILIGCLGAQDRGEEAYAAAVKATALAESDSMLWTFRLDWEVWKKRYAEAATTLEAMTQGHGAILNDLKLDLAWDILRLMKEAGATGPRTRVLKLFASDAFAPSDMFGSNDSFRFAYAQDRVSAGDLAAAEPVVASLEDPHNIAAASLDPRMRNYLKSTDVAAAAAKRLERHREWMARQPDRLRPLIAAAENLRQLGRGKEALDVLKSAEPRLAKLTSAEDKDYVNWWWNELAITYETLGRLDETVEAYRRGSKISEVGGANISQLINLALAQNRFGRPKDALATLAVRELSPQTASSYGAMLYRQARACALNLDGRSGEAAADIAFIKSHEKDAPGAVTDLMLCLGDIEAAAASVVRRLEDPELRAAMLLVLSDFDLALPPLATDHVAHNREVLKSRADVKAAIARAGGTRHFNAAEA